MQVALSFSSMTMCGLIHASILKMGRSYVTEEEEAEFIHHCRAFALRQVHLSIHCQKQGQISTYAHHSPTHADAAQLMV